jgi:hypothetical protein
MSGPVSPNDIQGPVKIPEGVFEIINALIQEKWDGTRAHILAGELEGPLESEFGGIPYERSKWVTEAGTTFFKQYDWCINDVLATYTDLFWCESRVTSAQPKPEITRGTRLTRRPCGAGGSSVPQDRRRILPVVATHTAESTDLPGLPRECV